MFDPKTGNRVILLGVALALAVASLYVQWGIIKIEPADLKASMTINGKQVASEGLGEILGGVMSSVLSGMEVPVSGLNGNMDVGNLKIPFWLPIAIISTGIVLTMLNAIRFSDISWKIVVALLIAGILAIIWALVGIVNHGTLGLGAFLAITSAVIGISQQNVAQLAPADQ